MVSIAVLLLIPSILGAVATRINYDILSYLPDDLDSAKGEALLEEPFHMAATTMLIVEDMPPEYTNQLQKEVEQVPGVSNAIWLSSLVGIQIPQEMIPADIRDIFFSGDATMMIVQYDQPGASEATMKSIEQVPGDAAVRTDGRGPVHDRHVRDDGVLGAAGGPDVQHRPGRDL